MKNYVIVFGLGAFSYGLIEVVWRGYSHWSMMIAGGLCFVTFTLIETRFKEIHLLYKCILGSATVTAVELIFGSFFNLKLGLGVWDYSNIPFNFRGQVCLLYSVLWGLLSAFAIPFSAKVIGLLKNRKEE